MIELGIVDISAHGRRRLSSLIEKWSWASPDGRLSVPQISLTVLSPEEVRFHGSIDVCILGPEIVACDVAFVSNVRRQLPDKILICILDARTYSLSQVEQLSRFGVDDILIDSTSSDEFFRRILLLQRRCQSKKKGRLIVVDSARGGVGKTFITAAVAEGWFAQRYRVCVVDCDVVSQDLTRFLQVRPHVSEALRLLVDQQRVVTSETVAECVHQVWLDEPRFVCAPPPAGGDEALFTSAHSQRSLISVLEVLLVQYDKVVVDTSGLVSSAKQALFQACDDLFFVVNRDASAAFANRQSLSLIAGYLRPDAALISIINDNGVGSASAALLKSDVVVISGRSMIHVVTPRSLHAAGWACSGFTPYRFLRRSLEDILNYPAPVGASRSAAGRIWLRMSKMLQLARERMGGALEELWRGKKKNEAADKLGQRALPARPLLSLETTLPEEEGLVSRPVLLG